MSKLYIIAPEKLGVISPMLYGHFTEHIGGVFYDGIWVGEDSEVRNIEGFRAELIEKLREIKPPVIRWPGGCFAETYNWRDGIGKPGNRPTRINWWTRNDGRYESNRIGTDEFIRFCRLVGAEPYIAANVTSMSPLDIREWIDYCNSPRGTTAMAKLREENGSPEPYNVKYWGVGNENWGGGGNMTPEEYSDVFRRYSVVMDNACGDLKLIGCGPNAADYGWTRAFMDRFSRSERHMNGYSAHYYCGSSGDPLDFNEGQWYQLLLQAGRMDEIINRHWSIIRGFGLEYCSRLVVDEWGAWHPDGSGPSKGYNLFEQQSTMRDSVISALTLNIFNNNCDKVMMANAAQMCNNLHCLFLAGGDKMCVTPTYHIFNMYNGHKGGEAVKTVSDLGNIGFTAPDGRHDSVPNISTSASIKDGALTLTVANLSFDTPVTLELEAVGFALGRDAVITELSNDDLHAHNDFASPDAVKPITYEGGSDRVKIPAGGTISLRGKIL